MFKCLVFVLVLGTSAFALPRFRVDNWADDFIFDNEIFAGDWSSIEQWKGSLCDGRSAYRGTVGGHIANIKFEMRDGYIEVTADLKEIWGRLDGSYHSKLSACLTVSGGAGLSAEWAHLRLFVYLNTDERESRVKSLDIQETVLGTLHFGVWMPNYLEEHATRVVNGGLKAVWSTRVGTWMNDRITKEIKGRRATNPVAGSYGKET